MPARLRRRHLTLPCPEVRRHLRAGRRSGRPEMRARQRVDQLGGNAHPCSRLAHRAFKDVAYAEIEPERFNVDCLTFVGESRIARVTKNQRTRDSAVMISSTMPSAKYSWSGSPLRLVKGNTAIDGLSA